MAKNKHANQTGSTSETNHHYHFGHSYDDQSVAASMAIDAAADREYFEQHPEKKERQRLATFHERRASGLLFGAMVLVVKLSDGSLARVVLAPPTQLN